MSWFTTPPNTPFVQCERCKKPGFAVLVRRGIAFDIYDCKRCGEVERKVKPQ